MRTSCTVYGMKNIGGELVKTVEKIFLNLVFGQPGILQQRWQQKVTKV